MPPDSEHPKTGGLPLAVGAYTLWGLLPLYLLTVRHVPAFELVGWRVIFTVPLCLLAVAVTGRGGTLLAVVRDRRLLLRLLLSAALIFANWLAYIYAVLNGHVLAGSLGYYINPLVNIALGTVVLKERLRPIQWVAVGIAAVGVSLLLGGALEMLWISLTLALSFASYGLVRKTMAVDGIVGLTVESIILLPVSLAIVAWFAMSPAGSSIDDGWGSVGLLALTGPVTMVPLVMFAEAARRMTYSALGFVQFLAPTLVFIIGVTLFDEALRPVQLACFILIWTAVALFSFDLLRRHAQRA